MDWDTWTELTKDVKREFGGDPVDPGSPREDGEVADPDAQVVGLSKRAQRKARRKELTDGAKAAKAAKKAQRGTWYDAVAPADAHAPQGFPLHPQPELHHHPQHQLPHQPLADHFDLPDQTPQWPGSFHPQRAPLPWGLQTPHMGIPNPHTAVMPPLPPAMPPLPIPTGIGMMHSPFVPSQTRLTDSAPWLPNPIPQIPINSPPANNGTFPSQPSQPFTPPVPRVATGPTRKKKSAKKKNVNWNESSHPAHPHAATHIKDAFVAEATALGTAPYSATTPLQYADAPAESDIPVPKAVLATAPNDVKGSRPISAPQDPQAESAPMAQLPTPFETKPSVAERDGFGRTDTDRRPASKRSSSSLSLSELRNKLRKAVRKELPVVSNCGDAAEREHDCSPAEETRPSAPISAEAPDRHGISNSNSDSEQRDAQRSPQDGVAPMRSTEEVRPEIPPDVEGDASADEMDGEIRNNVGGSTTEIQSQDKGSLLGNGKPNVLEVNNGDGTNIIDANGVSSDRQQTAGVTVGREQSSPDAPPHERTPRTTPKTDSGHPPSEDPALSEGRAEATLKVSVRVRRPDKPDALISYEQPARTVDPIGQSASLIIPMYDSSDDEEAPAATLRTVTGSGANPTNHGNPFSAEVEVLKRKIAELESRKRRKEVLSKEDLPTVLPSDDLSQLDPSTETRVQPTVLSTAEPPRSDEEEECNEAENERALVTNSARTPEEANEDEEVSKAINEAVPPRDHHTTAMEVDVQGGPLQNSPIVEQGANDSAVVQTDPLAELTVEYEERLAAVRIRRTELSNEMLRLDGEEAALHRNIESLKSMSAKVSAARQVKRESDVGPSGLPDKSDGGWTDSADRGPHNSAAVSALTQVARRKATREAPWFCLSPFSPGLNGRGKIFTPLQALKAFRLRKNRFPTQIDIMSSRWSHKLNPSKALCPFEMHGTCSDSSCSFLHERDYTASVTDIENDLLSYFPKSRVKSLKDRHAETNSSIEHCLTLLVRDLVQNAEPLPFSHPLAS